jgi:hypothetical protein
MVEGRIARLFEVEDRAPDFPTPATDGGPQRLGQQILAKTFRSR